MKYVNVLIVVVLFQKYEPDGKLSDFLYDKIISAENSFEKK